KVICGPRKTEKSSTNSSRFWDGAGAMQNKISFIGIAGVLIGAVMLISTSDLPDLSALFPRTVAWTLTGIGAIEILRNLIVGIRSEKQQAQIEAVSEPADPAEVSADEDTETGSGGQ